MKPALRGRFGQLGASAALRSSVALAALGTLPGALTCAAAFAMSLQPPGNPATAGPLPATLWYPVLILAGLWSLAFAPSPVLLLIAMLTGRTYLRHVMLTGWRWRTAWVGVAALGVATETLYLRAVVIVLWSPPAAAVSRPNWAAALLSAGFVTLGAAIIGVLAVAARVGRGPSRSAALRIDTAANGRDFS